MIGNQPTFDRYLRVICGVLPVQEFFAPENIESIMLAFADLPRRPHTPGRNLHTEYHRHERC